MKREFLEWLAYQRKTNAHGLWDIPLAVGILVGGVAVMGYLFGWERLLGWFIGGN